MDEEGDRGHWAILAQRFQIDLVEDREFRGRFLGKRP
jgi:hypothetical protein